MLYESSFVCSLSLLIDGNGVRYALQLELRSHNELSMRFPDILQDRLERLTASFAKAIAKYNYDGVYRGVFPIKVNQQRHIIEGIVKAGEHHNFGLEACSKPELLIALSSINDVEPLIICNGYKDRQYLETAILASKLNKKIVIVLEKLDEVCLAVQVAKELEITPLCSTTGEKAKFGMSITEISRVVDILKDEGMLDSLRLLHFHIGSQISSISVIKGALREASRLYTELVKLGAPMGYLDVGGGLAVDYDGSKSNFYVSKNYNMQNYANDVVAEVSDSCKHAKVPVPTLISESGRALASHQAVLIFDVLGQSKITLEPLPEVNGEEHYIITTLRDIYANINSDNCQESFHDVVQFKEEALSAFQLGLLSLKERALAENIYWHSCFKIYQITKNMEVIPEDLQTLDQILATTYYVNLSVFQSAPDSWALDQLFPIVPIHHLDVEPTEKVTLADLTCDSDGKIDKFIDIKEDTRPLLDVHPLEVTNGQLTPRLSHKPYYLGMFLLGAYQETLGNLHNMFGRTNAVQIELVPSGYKIKHIVRGDNMNKILSYFQYDGNDLLESVRQQCEEAISNGVITLSMSQKLLNNFEQSLSRYTYLS